MSRFWRVFAIAGVLFAVVGGLLLFLFDVHWPWALVPASMILGAASGGFMGGVARRLPPGRPGLPRFAANALAMSAAGAVVGFMLPMMAASWMPLPRGEWYPMPHQPPKTPVAFLGEAHVESDTDRKAYVLAADGTVYSNALDSLEGPPQWREERAGESPTTRLGARSFGLAVPPPPRKTISHQSFVFRAEEFRLWYYLALAEDGTVWVCYFAFYANAMNALVVVFACLAGVAGLLSSLALLFERKVVVDKNGSAASHTT